MCPTFDIDRVVIGMHPRMRAAERLRVPYDDTLDLLRSAIADAEWQSKRPKGCTGGGTTEYGISHKHNVVLVVYPNEGTPTGRPPLLATVYRWDPVAECATV